MTITVKVEPQSVGVYSYGRYLALGGRIDEENYGRVMKRVIAESGLVQHFARIQTSTTAAISGISLCAVRDETGVDPRFIYGILRHDVASDNIKHHHSQMSDQELLVESLRMLERKEESLAVIAKHPHITFS